MTLLPNSDFGIRGWDGNQYQVNAVCAHPKCGRLAAHKHHMWPRSYLRDQPQNWVRLGDGTIIGNLIGLCVEHHEMVTGEIGGYRSRLVWMAGTDVLEDDPPSRLRADRLRRGVDDGRHDRPAAAGADGW